MQQLRFALDLIAEMVAEGSRSVQVNTPTGEPCKLLLNTHVAEARRLPLLKLHQDIDIAFRAKVIAKDRAGQYRATNPMPAAEVLKRDPVDVEIGSGHFVPDLVG